MLIKTNRDFFQRAKHVIIEKLHTSYHICLIQFEAKLTEYLRILWIQYMYLPFFQGVPVSHPWPKSRNFTYSWTRRFKTPVFFFLIYSFLPVIDPPSPAGEVGNFPQQFQPLLNGQYLVIKMIKRSNKEKNIVLWILFIIFINLKLFSN